MAQSFVTNGEKPVGGLAPPPGVTPNFINPMNNQKLAFVVGGIGLALSTTCVWIRMWTKSRITKHTEWEDCK